MSVGNTDVIESTTADSITWGISAGMKYSYKWGDVKTVGEEGFEGSFGVSFGGTTQKTIRTSYTTNTNAQFTLPPNRVNCIHQMIFDQRTTLPYTAVCKIVPRLRFQNGFTAWGGGGSYRDNPKAGAIKDQFKGGEGSGPGGRQFRDFEFRRCDEIYEDARNDADPWFVSPPIPNFLNYSFLPLAALIQWLTAVPNPVVEACPGERQPAQLPA